VISGDTQALITICPTLPRPSRYDFHDAADIFAGTISEAYEVNLRLICVSVLQASHRARCGHPVKIKDPVSNAFT
jgi:hypothetical protein